MHDGAVLSLGVICNNCDDFEKTVFCGPYYLYVLYHRLISAFGTSSYIHILPTDRTNFLDG